MMTEEAKLELDSYESVFFSATSILEPIFYGFKGSREESGLFLDEIKDDAEVIYLLGDILDYWYEYRYVVPAVLCVFSKAR